MRSNSIAVTGGVIPAFEGLGNRLEDVWRGQDYDEAAFPRIAQEHLKRFIEQDSIEPRDILDWIFSCHQAFQQPNPQKLFGQPPITVYQASRFYIEVLFWFSGTTTIHEHGFSGSFGVFAGSSVHSHWSFDCQRTVSSRFLCGRLRHRSTEILHPGDVREIEPGHELIHQLFHLDMPSITIVARTYLNRNNLPQYQYFPPGLAIDPEVSDSVRTRRLMLLDAMAQGNLPGFTRYCQSYVEHSDLEGLYHLISLLSKRKIEDNVLEECFLMSRSRYGDAMVDLIRHVCSWEKRNRVVTALRSKVSDPECRFLLALLMLMPDRQSVLKAIQLQYPDKEPIIALEGWLEELSGSETLGFEMNEANRVIFRGLLQGGDMSDLLRRLRDEFQEESIAKHLPRLQEHAKQMARSDLLFPLFSESPLRDLARSEVDQ